MGNNNTNQNVSYNANMRRLKIYVCPHCGNILTATGSAEISCCGIMLTPLQAATPDEEHSLLIEPVEDEYFVSIQHDMTKDHYISFMAVVADNGFQLRKLYPEGNAEARFKKNRSCQIFYYCNHHGLFMQKL